MSSPRNRRLQHKSNTKHIPDSSEIRAIIDQYIDDVSGSPKCGYLAYCILAYTCALSLRLTER